MTRNILVPIDDAQPSLEALKYAYNEYPDASITIIHVINFSGVVAHAGAGIASELNEYGRKQAERLFDEARQIERSDDINLSTVALTGSPAQKIVEYANDNDIEHVVMGSHGREGVRRFFLGSVAERVIRRATMPVTIVQ